MTRAAHTGAGAVTLHIDRLCIEGLSRADALRARDAFERELERRLHREPALIERLQTTDAGRLATRPLRCGPQSRPERLGRDAAAALLEGLRR